MVYTIIVPWCSGCLLVFEPGSGGLLINIVCIAITSDPVKHSAYFRISGELQYWLRTGSNYDTNVVFSIGLCACTLETHLKVLYFSYSFLICFELSLSDHHIPHYCQSRHLMVGTVLSIRKVHYTMYSKVRWQVFLPFQYKTYLINIYCLV